MGSTQGRRLAELRRSNAAGRHRDRRRLIDAAAADADIDDGLAEADDDDARGPDGVYVDGAGMLVHEWHDRSGRLHRVGGPAQMRVRPDGSVSEALWYRRGQRHRIGGPAESWYYPDGDVEREAWFEFGKAINELMGAR